MKAKIYFMLMGCLVLSFNSCKKEEDPERYDHSKITVEVIDFNSNAALIAINAKDVKELGIFTIGICYSTSFLPTVENPKFEFLVNSDTLSGDDLDMFYIITDLNKKTDYNIRGYIMLGTEVFYSEKESFKTSDNTLNIEVSYNYKPDWMEYWIVLSDKGTTLLTQKLENNEIYTFNENIPDRADFHLFKWNPYNRILYVESYIDIVPDEFYLENPYYSTNLGQVSVTVSDLSNFLIWGVASSWWWNTTVLPETKTLSTSVSNNPEDLFIHYLPSDGSAPRYKVVHNVTPASEYTYTMADFSEMTDFVNIEVPSNLYFTYTLAGFNTDYYTEFKKFHGFSFQTGYTGTFKLYYPKDVNTNYYIFTFYNTSGTQSFYNKIGPMPTTFFMPFPAITISNSSQFTTTTSTIADFSKYEVMDFCGFYTGSDFRIQWDYFRQPQALNDVVIPEFPSDLKSQINNISVNDLSFSDVGYFDILNSPVESFETYVDLLIKQSERFYDVVKERRHYYQWVNKKSFDSTVKNYGIQELQFQ